jgi:hypothetical protein
MEATFLAKDDGKFTPPPTITVQIEMLPKAVDMLEELVKTGLYGHNVSEAAERIICEQLINRRQKSITKPSIT